MVVWRVGLTDVEAAPSNPDGTLTEVQSPMVAADEVPPLDGSWATLFDAPPI